MKSTIAGFADLPTWDLTDLYSSSLDPKLSQDLEHLSSQIDTFVGSYTRVFQGNFRGAQLFLAIKSYESINEGLSKLLSFAGLQYYGDLNNPDYGNLYQTMQEKVALLSARMVFFNLDVAKLTDDTVACVLKTTPELSHYHHWLKVVRKFQSHQLSEELERYVVEKSVTGRSAWIRLYDETLAAMQLKYDGQLLPLEAVVHKMADKDAEVRKSAAYALNEGLTAHLPLFVTITNVLAKDKAIEDKWRNFAKSDSSRHLDNQIEPEVVEALTACVRKNYGVLSHRYYALKAKMLGLKRLEYWDRNAPLPFDDDGDISWPVARKIVLDAYSAFSPTVAEIAQEFFDKNWIDVPVRVGKTSGAFSHPTVPSVHPYVLLNYQGRRRDVMTLAHELGHGVHQMLARGQGFLLADTPLTLAETASVFGEMLTFKHLLSTCATLEPRKALLAGKIDDMLNTVVRQIAFYEFEKQVHQARQVGELNADDLGNIWQRTQTEALGDAVHVDPVTQTFWAYIGHFIHSPFYVYAYAFGDCLVNSLYALYHKQPNGFVEKYLDLLQAGGSQDYNHLLQPFGFDLKQPVFWQNGLQVIADLIDELESL